MGPPLAITLLLQACSGFHNRFTIVVSLVITLVFPPVYWFALDSTLVMTLVFRLMPWFALWLVPLFYHSFHPGDYPGEYPGEYPGFRFVPWFLPW